MNKAILAGFAACSLALSSSATVIFMDDFNTEPAGLSTPSLINWDIVSGSVDVIPIGGSYDFYPGNGRYLDMDGSSSAAGAIQKQLTLAAGSYLLSYDLGGSARNQSPTDSVQVMVHFSSLTYLFTHTLDYDAGLGTYALPFTLNTAQPVTLNFAALLPAGAGNDYMGLILDNVKLETTSVPDAGTTLSLLGLALVGLTTIRRRF
jgi:hypothetical protein